MGLARQGEQRGDRGGETMTESRCKLTLVETDRGAIAWCMKHVVGSDHDQHQLRPVARELVPATEATANLLSVGCRQVKARPTRVAKVGHVPPRTEERLQGGGVVAPRVHVALKAPRWVRAIRRLMQRIATGETVAQARDACASFRLFALVCGLRCCMG